MNSTALYPRLMGDGWHALDDGIRDIHVGGSQTRLSGSFEIQCARTRLGRLVCKVGGLPTTCGTSPCDVLVEASPRSERWSRTFGTWKLASTQFEDRGFLIERVGPFDLFFRLSVERGGIRFTQVRAYLRVLGARIPIPGSLAPKVAGLELPGANGAARIDIALSVPIAGTLIRYVGEVTRSGT